MESPASPATFYESYLNLFTKYRRQKVVWYFWFFSCCLFSSKNPNSSSSQWIRAQYSSDLTRLCIAEFCGRLGARSHQGKCFPSPLPNLTLSYMKNGVDFIHWKVLLDLNDEKIDHLFIRLKQVNWIVTFTNEDLAIFTGQELHILLVNDCRVSEFEGTVHEWYVVRIVMR